MNRIMMSVFGESMSTRQGEKNGNLANLNNMIAEVKEVENDRDAQKLQKLAGQHIKAIMALLDRQQEKIDNAKRLANRAQSIAKEDTAWNSIKQKITFGTAGIDIVAETTRLNSEGLLATNEAMEEMNKVIRGVVALTCCSTAYSKIMIDTMGGILTDGFINAAGQRQQLSESQKEVVKHILATTKQRAMKDLEQDEKINQIFEILKKKDEIDSRQEEQIRKNAKLIAQNQQNILELQKRNNKIMAILALVAITLSAVSLSISIFCLLK